MRSETKIIAAVDSLDTTNADYLCDGTDDEVQINQALNDVASGGRVLLREGTYHCADSVVFPDQSNIQLSGLGKGISVLQFNNLTTSLVKKTNPLVRRYALRVADLTIDNQSRENIGAIGIDWSNISDGNLERISFLNVETAVRLIGNSYFNNIYEVKFQQCEYGFTFQMDENGRPNENRLYACGCTGNVSYPVNLLFGNDNHFIANSFEDFTTAIYVNDVGNEFISNRIECNDRPGTVTYVSLGINSANNGFLNNYYSGNNWTGRATSIIDNGNGNSFIETANFKDQFVHVRKNQHSTLPFFTLERTGTGNGVAMFHVKDSYANSGQPIQFLASSVRAHGKFYQGILSGVEKYSVNEDGLYITGSVNNQWQPSQHGFISWAFDPMSCSGSDAPQDGVLHLTKLWVNRPTTISKGYINVSYVGSGNTNAYMAIYDAAGNLLGQSDNQAGNMNTLGMKTFTFTPMTIPTAGFVYLAFWVQGGTLPYFSRGAIGVANINVGSNYRIATANTGVTNTAPATLGAKSNGSISYWTAIG